MNPDPKPTRRRFLAGSAALAATAVTGLQHTRAQAADTAALAPAAKFKLAYAPHPGMFKESAGNDVLDQIRFCADQGFTAFEYNDLPGQSPAIQEKIGKLLADLGMQMGVFVAYGNFDEPIFTAGTKERRTEVIDSMHKAVEIAKRVGAKWFTVVPGSVDQQVAGAERNRYGTARLAEGYQTANAIDLLRRCAGILEPHNLVMVLEPLNWHANHGGVFLRHSDQAYALCKAVDSPSCKILFDIYHQQISEGNLIPNIDRCWDEIAYFQSGDNPGRKEPGTGEINYRNVFRHIHQRCQKDNLNPVIGMEHGNSKPGVEGEQAVIAAYRDADAF